MFGIEFDFMKYNLSKSSKSRLEGLHPFLLEVIDMALTNSPDDFGIPPYGGLRTTQDQKKLYDKGRTIESIHKGEKPVTYVDGVKKLSKHQIKDGYGCAFDVFIFDHFTSKASWNAERLTELALHILKCAELVKENNEAYKDLILIWGGSWKRFKDLPHFQISI